MKTFLSAGRNAPRPRWLLLAGVLFAFSGGIASAQMDDQDSGGDVTESDESQYEEVIVTGSRVAKDTFSSISPLQVVDGEVARDLGLVDTADLLKQTTVVQGQQFTTGLSTSAGLLSDSGPGSATASLRGLDAGRTLVLVNGRRLAPAGVRGAPSAPDLNMVPGTLIQRVDVLLDGASSVYGSDAVAGVVNVILRSDFDGLQIEGFQRVTNLDNDGGNQFVANATWGINNDVGFMGFAMEFSETEGYAEGDIGDFYSPYSGDCRSNYYQGASGEIYEQCSGSFGHGAVSSGGLGFFGYDGTTQFPGFPPGFFPIPVTADLLTPGSVNGAALLLWPEEFNATFAPDFKRMSVFTIGEYSPGWYGDSTMYFEASWASRQTSTNTSGQSRIRVPGDYALGNFGGVTGTLYFNENFVAEAEVAQTRVTAGIKGDMPFMEAGSFTGWTYDAYASYSRSTGQDTVMGAPYFPRLEQTLSNTRFDPVLGQFVCDPRTVTGEAQQVTCRPLDFFQPSFIFNGRFTDPADNAYLFPNRTTNTIVEQKMFQGFVTGEMFDIPWGGPASLVFGLEYREDRIRTDTGAGVGSGDFFRFFADPGSNGSRYLKEVFTEIDLPFVTDRPGVQELSANLAGRYTEEKSFGEETTYRVQAQYAPVEWLRFRATTGTSFRAPNLGEQFGGSVVGFGNPSDPCRTPGVSVPFVDHDNDPNTPEIRLYNPGLDPREQTVIDNCLNGGGPFGLEATNPFALGIRGLGTQNPVFFGAPTQVATGSNPQLRAETSTSSTYGIVFEQPWSDRFGLRISVNYFDIEIEDEVDQLTAQTIAARCYNSPGLVDLTCGFITRAPRDEADDTSGEITFISALNQNLGTQVAKGVDYNIDFNMDFSAVNWNLILRATESTELTGEEFRATEIFVNDDLREFGNPEWRANLTNVVEWGDWSFLWQTRYLGEQIEDNDDPEDTTSSFFSPCVQAGDTPCVQFEDLDDYIVHDFSVAWRSDSYVVRLGVNNVFNEAPPLTANNGLNLLGGIGYQLNGRTVFLNVSAGL